jgi:DNA-binding transcriptional regulator YiaG
MNHAPASLPEFDADRFAAEVDLTAVRVALGWTQAEMAQAMCCDRSQISRWEAGHTQPHGLARRHYWRMHWEIQAKNRAGRAA